MRGHKLQPGLLEPCALKGARTVLRGRGSGDTASLPDNLVALTNPFPYLEAVRVQ